MRCGGAAQSHRQEHQTQQQHDASLPLCVCAHNHRPPATAAPALITETTGRPTPYFALIHSQNNSTSSGSALLHVYVEQPLHYPSCCQHHISLLSRDLLPFDQ